MTQLEMSTCGSSSYAVQSSSADGSTTDAHSNFARSRECHQGDPEAVPTDDCDAASDCSINDAATESSINDSDSDSNASDDSGTDDSASDDEPQPVLPRPRQQLHHVWQQRLLPSDAQMINGDEQPSQQSVEVWQLELQQSVDHARQAEVVKVEEGELRPVSPRVLKQLQISLAGPCSSGNRAVRVWTCAGSATNGFIAAYLGICLLNQMYDPAVWFLQYTALPVWGGIGMLAGEYTTLLGRALLDVGGDGTEKLLVAPESAAQPSEGTNFTFLLSLLKTPVSAEVCTEVERKLLISRVLAGGTALLFIFCYLTTFLSFTSVPTDEMLPLRGIGCAEMILCWIGAFCCWPSGMLLSGWLLFIKVPCVLVSDRIRRDARLVARLSSSSRGSTFEQHDLDMVQQVLQMAHEHTTRLATILQPLLELMLCIPVIGGSWWLILGCTPRSGMDPRSPVRDVMQAVPKELFLGGAALLIFLGLWPLYAPGAVTGACDELVEAVQALPHSKQQAADVDAVAARTAVLEADCEQPDVQEDISSLDCNQSELRRVHSLVQYAAGLNSGQGLGFTFRKKRIGTAFVNRSIRLAFGSAMVLVLVLSCTLA